MHLQWLNTCTAAQGGVVQPSKGKQVTLNPLGDKKRHTVLFGENKPFHSDLLM